MKAILSAATLSLLIGVTAGVVVSRSYWGYYLGRPGLPLEVTEARVLRSVTPLRPVGRGAGCSMEVDPAYSISDRMQWARQAPYYEAEGRLLLNLAERGLSPLSAPPDRALPAPEIYRQLGQAGTLVAGEAGYDLATCVSGVAVEVADHAGQSTLVVGLRGRQVSNDHYPYYEAVFGEVDGGWQLRRWQRYFYDLAGIEGLEGPWLSGIFAVLTFAAACGVAIIYSATTGVAGRVRRRRTKGGS